MSDCLSRAKPGDEIWISRIDPVAENIAEPFPTILVLRPWLNTWILGCNIRHGLYGLYPARQFLKPEIANKFSWFAFYNTNAFKLHKIVKKCIPA